MQITINNILTFMRDKQNFNISEEQEQEIKDHFYQVAENYVYWYFIDEDTDKINNGIIKKEFYSYVKTLDPHKVFTIHGDTDYTIDDLTFIEDPEFINFYTNSHFNNDDGLKESIENTE